MVGCRYNANTARVLAVNADGSLVLQHSVAGNAAPSAIRAMLTNGGGGSVATSMMGGVAFIGGNTKALGNGKPAQLSCDVDAGRTTCVLTAEVKLNPTSGLYTRRALRLFTLSM